MFIKKVTFDAFKLATSMSIKKISLVIAILFSIAIQSQTKIYKAEREKINNLVHTKLDINFDIPNSELNGEAWVTLTPHFSPVSKVSLDAKGMTLHSVTINNKKAAYNYYKNKELIIELDRTYIKGEKFTVYIKYTSHPNEYAKINNGEKGLYFIDPTDSNPNKRTQIWSESEPENSSIWFPTIDSPNQKSTQEIYITVPDKFVTLSNGTLINEKENTDGTRTDYWKQDQKHAPYLFFIAAGEFSIVEDFWNEKPVNYYIEEEYEDVAKEIFGKTPAMLQFFEDLLGVEYPWDKYSQIVVEDYVSGAMENTTAVIHGTDAYQELGALIDENTQENTISHEVFHHWFGDLVTAESWSNLPMNEAFANYGEYLWLEHAYGKEVADAHLFENKEIYFKGVNESKDLIRFYVENTDDMFDSVSYEKGGLILHMLRNYLGDDVFFAGLTKYLNDNKFSTAEAHQLRLAMEDVSGKDLNWFFNKWFFGNGHPKLQVISIYDDFNNIVDIKIYQGVNVFEFPLTIDVYEKNGQKSSHQVWMNKKEQSFSFNVSSEPKLIDVGAKRVLLAEILQNKTLEQYIYQYNHADAYEARKEALERIAKNQDNKNAFKAMQKAMGDNSPKLQIFALENLDLVNKYAKVDAVKIVERLSKKSDNTLVQAAANITLAKLVDPAYIPHFESLLKSKSFKVIESGVIGLYQMDRVMALKKVDALPESVKDHLSGIITSFYIDQQDEKYMNYISSHIINGLFFNVDEKLKNKYMWAFQWISKSDNEVAVKNLVSSLVDSGIQYKKYGADVAGINFLRQMVAMQKEANHPNEEELVLVIRTGMAQLRN